MNDRGKSDSPVVPAKPPNKTSVAEVVEGRGLAKGNTASKTRPGHRAEEPGVSRTGDFGFLRDVVLFEPCQLDFIGSHISQCRVKPDLVIP